MSSQETGRDHPVTLEGELLQSLIALQTIEDDLRGAREELAQLPDRLRLRTGKLVQATAAFDDSAQLMLDTQKMIDAKNVDAGTIEATIQRSGEQLLSLVDQKHIDTMQHQIVGLKARLSECQDGILELMMALDDLTPPHETLTEKKAALEDEVAELTKHVEVRGVELVDEIAAFEGARREASEAVQPNVLSLFDAAANTDERRGIASAENEICQGCDTRLTPQLASNVLNAHFILCPHCDRILHSCS